MEMKTSKFKMTELGPIPEGWEVKPLGDVAETSSGGTPSRARPDFFQGTIKWFTTTELLDCKLYDSIEHISNEALKNSSAKVFPPKTLLMAMYGATIGRLGVLQNHASTNQACCAIFCGDALFPDYAYYYLYHLRPNIIERGCGAGQPNISQEIVRSLPVVLPPLPEQEKIAEALSDVDALLSAMTTLIEKKRAIKQGAMQELLGMRNDESGMRNVPRCRLAGFSGEWVEKRLGECGSFSKGAGISRAQANSGRIPAVRYGELYTTHHEYIKTFESFISDDVARCSTKLTRGDIVFACSGETKEEIGKCAAFIGDEIAYAGGDLLILSPKEMYDSKFLAFELNIPFCALQKAAAGQGDAVVHIRQRSLEELIVRIPPTLAEQQAIAAVLSDMDAEIAALEAKRAKYESIKQGMMQELLTGKTRLKGE